MRLARYSACQDAGEFRADFSALPTRLRRRPYRHGMLDRAVCERFLTAPYPAAHDFWLCYQEGRAIGGISANVSASHPDTGCFGLLEFDTDSCEAGAMLLIGACDWLSDQGVKRVVGPMAFNTWFPYRFRLPDSEPHSFDWEPCNPPDYVQLLEDNGFGLTERYNSIAFGQLEKVAAQLEADYRRVLAEGFRVTAFDEGSVAEHVPTLFRLSHASFAENDFFEPIPENLFAEAYIRLADKGGRIRAWLLLEPDGEPVGLFYTFVDRHDGETVAVLKSIGVVPGMRGRGLSNALVYLGVKAAADAGVDYAISALVHSGNPSGVFAGKGRFRWRHDYALWQKTIA